MSVDIIPDEKATEIDLPEACFDCAETRAMVADMQAKLDQMITLVGEIKELTEPTITALMDSPIIKMLGVKK